MKLKRFLFYLSHLTIGLPWTIIAALIWLGILLFYRKNIAEVKIVCGRVCLLTKRNVRMGGISLGLFYAVSENTLHYHTHELGHTVQSAYWGFLFPFVIGLPSLIRAALWGNIQERSYKKTGRYKDYEGVWFEAQATKLGHKHFTQKLRRLLKESDY